MPPTDTPISSPKPFRIYYFKDTKETGFKEYIYFSDIHGMLTQGISVLSWNSVDRDVLEFTDIYLYLPPG